MSKGNKATQSFEKHHSLNFFYTDDVTVEYALWNLTADHHLTNESVQLFLFLRHWGRPGSPVPEVVFPGAEPLAPRFRRNIFDTYQLFLTLFRLFICTFAPDFLINSARNSVLIFFIFPDEAVCSALWQMLYCPDSYGSLLVFPRE